MEQLSYSRLNFSALLVFIFLFAQCTGDKSTNNHTDTDAGTDATDIIDDTITRQEVWCNTQWPLTTQTSPGAATESLYVRVDLPGLIITPPIREFLEVDVGFGPTGVHPGDASWQWETSDYNASCLSCGSDVEYMGQITPLSEGTYHWGARVRYDSGPWQYCDRSDDGLEGSTDGWTPQTAPSLIVSRDLRVVTLNLRCLLDDFASRLPLIVDTLTASDADLIGVQEVCTEDGPLGHDNLTEIINALSTRTGKQYQIVRTVTHRSWDTYDEGIALVTPHAIIDESETSLPMGAFLRKVVMARVETPLGTVIMATTHLDHLDAQTRVDQATAAISALTAFNSLSEPLILTGDFNEGPDAVVHSLMTDAGFSDLWSNLYPLDPGYTFPMPAPDIRIDYIWLNHKITPLSISRILDTPVAGVTGSDHAGLSGTVGVQ